MRLIVTLAAAALGLLQLGAAVALLWLLGLALVRLLLH